MIKQFVSIGWKALHFLQNESKQQTNENYNNVIHIQEFCAKIPLKKFLTQTDRLN